MASSMLMLLFSVTCLPSVLASLELTHVSSLYLPYQTDPALYAFGSSAVEQLSYHHGDKTIYCVGSGLIHVVDASDATNLQTLHSFEHSEFDYTDVEVCGDYVFVAIDNKVNRTEGMVHVYSTFNRTMSRMELLHSITVGSLPDMLYPRKDCGSVVIALEAEAFTDPAGTFHDPESAVVLVTFPRGVASRDDHVVESFDFRKYNDRVSELLPSGVRFVYREDSNPFSADVEPEYVAIDEENDQAYIMLQENNAIATFDLNRKNITSLVGLGYKQWGHLDASNEDGGIHISYWPIRSWYLPDELKFCKWKGQRLLFSANEGDSKDYGGHFNEEMRGHDVDVDTQLGPSIHPMVRTALKDDALLGRLKMSKYDGLNAQGRYEALYAFGGRGFSIRNAETKELLYDSGSDVEDMTALHCPHLFNGQYSRNGGPMETDDRSDDKGPETESIAVGELHDRLYIFIGNERPGVIAVYSVGSDVTKPRFEAVFCDGMPASNRTAGQLFEDKLIYGVDPEDLKFYPADQSPTGRPALMVVGSVSASISIIEVKVTPDTGDLSDKNSNTEYHCPKIPDTSDSASHSLLGNGYASPGLTILASIVLCFYICSY